MKNKMKIENKKEQIKKGGDGLAFVIEKKLQEICPHLKINLEPFQDEWGDAREPGLKIYCKACEKMYTFPLMPL
jgi:hypothetical protein